MKLGSIEKWPADSATEAALKKLDVEVDDEGGRADREEAESG